MHCPNHRRCFLIPSLLVTLLVSPLAGGCASSPPKFVVTTVDVGHAEVEWRFSSRAPRSGDLTLVEFDGNLTGLAAGEGSLWVRSGWHLLRIDPQTIEIVAAISMDPVAEFAFGEGAVWALAWGGFRQDFLIRLDVATHEIVARVPVDDYSGGVAVGGGGVWVGTGKTVTRIDPETNQVVATIPIGRISRFVGSTWTRVVVGSGSVWVLKMGDGVVYRIDPVANRVAAKIQVGRPFSRKESLVFPIDRLPYRTIAAAEGAVWVTQALPQDHEGGNVRRLLRIDPRTNQVVARIPLSGDASPAHGTGSGVSHPMSMTSHGGSIWISTTDCGLQRVDPRANELIDVMRLPLSPRHECHGTAQIVGISDAIWAINPVNPPGVWWVNRKLWRIPIE